MDGDSHAFEPHAELHEGVDERGDVPLADMRKGRLDKLGNRIEEIFWCGGNYTVYRTCKGVFVHFSDDPQEAEKQRKKFTEICPELCELRYLTAQMDKGIKIFGVRFCSGNAQDSLFDHNIAQAIMLLMEDKAGDAQDIADSALKLAVSRATNDNTIKYVLAAVVTVAALIVALAPAAYLDHLYGPQWLLDLVVAAIAGAIGALFSIITRLQSFELKPCQESGMNYLVSTMRIVMGSVAAVFLLLLARTPIGSAIMTSQATHTWADAAVIGFIGGFAERLVQTLAQKSANAIGDRGGTPVQAARIAQRALRPSKHAAGASDGSGDLKPA